MSTEIVWNNILIDPYFLFQNQILQLQNAITKLKIENETLKKQIDTLEATVMYKTLIWYNRNT